MSMFTKILVANRGEIAVRIITACQELGIPAVAVYSEADRNALHAQVADEAYLIGPAPAAQSYLSIPAIIEAAKRCGAQAIHPGYGFLSENAEFAEACSEAGIVFIGPTPAAIRLLGSKTAAKDVARRVGVPTVPGYVGEEQSAERFLSEARKMGFPVMLKPANGGGGKGMRDLWNEEGFAEALAGAKREALGAFGDEQMFLEKLIVEPRHVEFQILADAHGSVIHLGERECSIQRRHQKIVEESPSVALTPELRAEMGAAAVRVAQEAGYVNAGTVEFLLDRDGHYYFLEMNTRLQVEHPVTEEVAGLNLVKHQIAIAAGEPLRLKQEQIVPRGHAIEMRLYAEDPATGFLPSIGRIDVFQARFAPGVRVDSGVASGSEVTVHYDPMLAKLIASGEDRQSALERLRWMLEHIAVLGIETNLPLLRAIAGDADFAAGRTFTDFLEKHDFSAQFERPELPPEALLAAAALEVVDEPPRPTAQAAGSARLNSNRPFNPWTQGGALRRGGEQTLTYSYHEQNYQIVLTPQADVANTWDARIAQGKAQKQQPATQEMHHLSVVMKRLSPQAVMLEVDAQRGLAFVAQRGYEVLVSWHGVSYRLEKPRPLDVDAAAAGGISGRVASQKLMAPMAGTIVKVYVHEGDQVEARQTLLVLSAMKMEHSITATHAGVVKRLPFTEGAAVPGGAVLVELGEAGDTQPEGEQDNGAF
ncbi:MAG TPA: acetyl-CoA carboxylase biotin carboxylase subunit [Ktedonobacterales bacterium]